MATVGVKGLMLVKESIYASLSVPSVDRRLQFGRGSKQDDGVFARRYSVGISCRAVAFTTQSETGRSDKSIKN